MTKKVKKSQVLRHFIQLIMFCVFPGFYAMIFSEVKSLYEMVIKGNFNFLQVFQSLVEFIVVMIITILIGRWFCGWICSFGGYNDLIYSIAQKVFKIKFKVNEKVDSILKYIKYVILIFIIIVSWTTGSNILEGTSPWDAFGKITNLSVVFSGLLIGSIFLILITIGATFIERFFCRYLCPLGTIFSIISKIGIVKINKPKDECGKCRACTMNCSMGLNLYKVDNARGGECINCLKCTEVCPRRNANINVLGKDINQNLAGSVAAAAILSVYGLTNLGANALTKAGIISKDNTVSSEASQSLDFDNYSQKYKDGTYIGSGEGFNGGTTKISVTISDGRITNIEILSNEDDHLYFEKAFGFITKEILSKQSTSVDTVSGATFSSKGIISAVKNALSQVDDSDSEYSDKNSSRKDETATSSSSENTKNIITTGSSEDQFKDGTYIGSGEGFRGGMTEVSLTITDGKITNVEILSNEDSKRYFDKAADTITKEILSKQSTEVDVVSGATHSSKGIMSAVADALSEAK